MAVFDAVIVGAGHNALVCALYLAKAGRRVLVLERSAEIGGALRSAQLTLPGFVHDLYATNVGQFAMSPVYRDFAADFARVGLEFLCRAGRSKAAHPQRRAPSKKPFRPIIADSVVLSVVNTGEIAPNDFVVAPTGTALTPAGRRRFVEAYERRLSQETTHPIFGYRLSMRRLILVQARLLARYLLGELSAYPHYLPR